MLNKDLKGYLVEVKKSQCHTLKILSFISESKPIAKQRKEKYIFF